jgi:ABC-type uncharacterized transport system ATPase subunit
MERITKRFPGIVANDKVSLSVRSGGFHAVIGENGAGKSTLLNVLYGLYRADEGRITLRGEDVTQALHSPADAIRRGVGLVSQHYALIPALSVIENVMLGAEPLGPGGILNRRAAAERIAGLTEKLGLQGLDLNQRAERLSVAAQQKVEILKALFRGATLLLLDEPTATLAPQEADALFALLHALVEEGATVVFVTHKLREVMTHSDAVTVLRGGRNAGDFRTADTDEQELLRCMIGERAPRSPNIQPSSASASTAEHTLLRITDLTVRNARHAIAVQNAGLELRAGEILGIAGVDGSGQRELSEAIVGLRRAESGELLLLRKSDDMFRESVALRQDGDSESTGGWFGTLLNPLSVRKRQQLGIAYIPEDRHRAGMIMEFTIAENYLLGHENAPEWGGGAVLHASRLFAKATQMVRDYDVRMGSRDANSLVRDLSGGNQQKVVIARAMDSAPCLLVACQPTRGLDRGATVFVYDTLRQARARGLGILLFSLDLDEILELSDRIAVMFNGRIVGLLDRTEATPERIGALMTGATEQWSEDSASSPPPSARAGKQEAAE